MRLLAGHLAVQVPVAQAGDRRKLLRWIKSLLEVMISAGFSEPVSGEIRREQIEVSGMKWFARASLVG